MRSELSKATGWPVLSLDTIKNPFLGEIEGVDRPFNRKLGRASLKAMFAIVAEAPAGTTMILDAWFGFQPRELVLELIASSGADVFRGGLVLGAASGHRRTLLRPAPRTACLAIRAQTMCRN